MVDGCVVDSPRDGRRLFYYSHIGLVDETWLNWRPGGTIRGKWRQLVGKVGEWYVASRHI
jgi:hypothetical protein